MASDTVISVLSGSSALSAFRSERRLKAARAVCPGVQAVSGRYVHFVNAREALGEDEGRRLAALLVYGFAG